MPSNISVPALDTDRLALRRPEPRDREHLIALANDWEVAKTLARLPFPYREDDADFYFKEVVPSELIWAITLEDKFIGSIGLTPDDEGRWELGYWIGQPYWNHGYVTEAARSIISWAIVALADSVIISGCFVENKASYRILQKLGFIETGQSSRSSLARGEMLQHHDMMFQLEHRQN